MRKLTLPLLFFFSPLVLIAQEKQQFGISFNGFVKTDLFWDSRETVSIREGHFLLYPENEELDENGEDINAKASFNFLSIQTRLKGTITGPDALGAKTSGVIEGEFFGHSDGDINGFRLRHAFVKLTWKSTELLVGQYWHPNFVTSSFPWTISFNTGTPFLTFSRNPQIRLKQSAGKFNFILTALAQRDFVSNGPEGPSSIYLRNSALPALNLRIEYHKINESEDREFLIGASANFKVLTPRTSTSVADTLGITKTYKRIENINSLAGTFYFKVKVPAISIKFGGTYAQDPYNWLMIGGYAVKEITDEMKDFRSYANTSTMAGWLDIHSNGKTWQIGLFTGYTQNLGASGELEGPYYSRGANIAYIYRISPRFIYNVGKFRFAPEIEYTAAGYGTPDEKGVVKDTGEVANVRFLLGVYLFF